MIYLETPSAKVEWDSADNIITVEWRGFVDGEAYRGVMEAILELIISKSSTKLLSDTRHIKVLTPEDQAWATKDWVVRAYKNGLKWNAALVPKSALAKMSIDRMTVAAGTAPGGATRHFDDLEKARDWLRSVR